MNKPARTIANPERPVPEAERAGFMSPETRFLDLPGEVELELGGRLATVRVAYRTWGALDLAGANAVVVCHALTGSADADRWWTRMFGPGRALPLPGTAARGPLRRGHLRRADEGHGHARRVAWAG